MFFIRKARVFRVSKHRQVPGRTSAPARLPRCARLAAVRIAVMGAGAVGGYFGGRLAQAGETVAFVARGAHLGAIQAAASASAASRATSP